MKTAALRIVAGIGFAGIFCWLAAHSKRGASSAPGAIDESTRPLSFVVDAGALDAMADAR